jgi:hypothetical protein
MTQTPRALVVKIIPKMRRRDGVVTTRHFPFRHSLAGIILLNPLGFCADSGAAEGRSPFKRKGSGEPKSPEPAALKT